MATTLSYTWTTHTFICRACGALCYASKEAIQESREGAGDSDASDADVAGSFEYCLECCDGKIVEGEKVPCEGERDIDNKPCCGGPNVRRVTATGNGETFDANWCEECCASAAVRDGYTVTRNGLVLATSPEGWEWKPLNG